MVRIQPGAVWCRLPRYLEDATHFTRDSSKYILPFRLAVSCCDLLVDRYLQFVLSVAQSLAPTYSF